MADGTKRAAAVAFDADCAAQKRAKVGLSAKEAELLSVVRRCVRSMHAASSFSKYSEIFSERGAVDYCT